MKARQLATLAAFARRGVSRPTPLCPLQWLAVSAVAVAAAALWVSGAQAQTPGAGPSVQQVPRSVAPAVPATNSLPSPSGLVSPSPLPAGLPPVVTPSAASPTTGGPGFGAPAGGVGSGLGVGRDESAGIGGSTAVGNPTAVLGAGSGVPPIPQSVPSGAGPYTPVDVARSFLGADANRNGEITRGEWHRLSIRPGSFEAMDRNFDGRISRSEYDDGLR